LEEQGNTLKERHQLLNLLFRSGHPETFIHLYHAIKEETHLEWLVKKIDEMTLHEEHLETTNPVGKTETCTNEQSGLKHL